MSTFRDDMKSFFEPVVDKIMALVKEQVKNVSKGDSKITVRTPS
jgi:hypothetical protein